MSKEKQIEEMADVYDRARLKARETLGSMNEGEAMWYSKAFYKAGYRKQSEGEWVEKDDGFGGVYYDCTACGCSWTTIDGTPMENNMNYCPECGAKMKGGAE